MISPQLQEYLKHNSFESLGLPNDEFITSDSFRVEHLLTLEKHGLLDLFLYDFPYNVCYDKSGLESCIHIFRKYIPGCIDAYSNYTGEVIYCYELFTIMSYSYINIAPIKARCMINSCFNMTKLKIISLINRERFCHANVIAIEYWDDSNVPFRGELIQIGKDKIIAINKDHRLYSPELEQISYEDWQQNQFAIVFKITGEVPPQRVNMKRAI